MQYTIGQRISVGGLPEKYYVVEKCLETNRVFAVPGQYHPRLYSVRMRTLKPHWLVPQEVVDSWDLEEEGLECRYMVSYLGHESSCRIRRLRSGVRREEAEENGEKQDEEEVLEVEFDLPHRAVTPGQTAVFYIGTNCIGSAQISGVVTAADSAELGGLTPEGEIRHLDRYQVTGIDP